MLRAFGHPVQHMSKNHPTMLQDVVLKCCERLARKDLTPNANARSLRAAWPQGYEERKRKKRKFAKNCNRKNITIEVNSQSNHPELQVFSKLNLSQRNEKGERPQWSATSFLKERECFYFQETT